MSTEGRKLKNTPFMLEITINKVIELEVKDFQGCTTPQDCLTVIQKELEEGELTVLDYIVDTHTQADVKFKLIK